MPSNRDISVLVWCLLLFRTVLGDQKLTCPTLLKTSNPIDSIPSSIRINGGNNSSLPFLAALQFQKASQKGSQQRTLCSGTLISSQWILTAAHCNISTDWLVYLPSYDATNITKVIIHSDFNKSTSQKYWADIALLRLSHHFDIKNATISTQNHIDLKKVVRAGGYGEPIAPPMARTVDMYIRNISLCQEKIQTVIVNSTRQVCAGYEHCTKNKKQCIRCSACRGDSGGPLLEWKTNKGWQVIALTSLGVGCKHGTVGIYVKIAPYHKWIMNMIRIHSNNRQNKKTPITNFNSVQKEKIQVVVIVSAVLIMMAMVLLTIGVIVLITTIKSYQQEIRLALSKQIG